jgi:hypothetical protein
VQSALRADALARKTPVMATRHLAEGRSSRVRGAESAVVSARAALHAQVCADAAQRWLIASVARADARSGLMHARRASQRVHDVIGVA